MKRIYMFIMTILCSIGIAVAISYAWFLNDENVDPIAQGRSGSAYFAYGDGGITKPYGINQPRHLYNLAWLVYLFPETYANLKYEIDPSLSETLNMNGWVLPPIGTDANPFTGYFDGNGKTIENLTTSNNVNNMSTKPNDLSNKVTNNVLNDCDSMGLFGSITKEASETDAKVHDFYLQGTSVETAQSATCIGIVAGYVDAKIENVGVVNSGVNLGGSAHTVLSGHTNLSDYTVVGYATEDYTTSVADSKTVVYNATTSFDHFNYRGMGEQTAWGGSMDMKKLYDRIFASVSAGTASFSYVNKELRRENDNGSYTVIKSQNGTSASTAKMKAWGGSNGTYIRSTASNTSNNFLSLTSLYKEEYTISKDGVVTGYKIHDGNNHYLSYNATNDEYETVTSADSASIWILDSDGGLLTYDFNEYSEDIVRYLNGTTDLLVSMTSTKSTTWSWDNTYSTFKYKNGTNWYYLVCVDGNFKAVSDLNYYIITDGTNYLVNNNGTISSTTTKNNASVWSFSNNGTNPNGVLTDIDSGKKLAINGNNLTANNSGTNWSYDGTNLFNGNKVIKFNGSNWILETQSSFLIHYGDHYLLNTLGDTQTKSNATSWTFSNDLYDVNGSGSISYTSSNITYYLNYKSSGSRLEVTQSNTTTWNHDQYGIYYNDGGTKYYIQYDSGWKASSTISQGELDGFYIHYENNYLTANGITGTQNSTTPTTIWYVDSDNLVYTIINGTNYYLYANNNNSWNIEISTSTTNRYMYKKDGETILYIYSSSTPYYIRYDGGWAESTALQNLVWTHPIGDDYAHTPIATIGWVTDYISRCDQFIGLSRNSIETYKYKCKKTQEASAFNYIPINASDSSPYGVATNNTGYIMAGGYESESNTDIRVSKFTQNQNIGWGITGSFNTSSKVWKENSIYTVGASGVGKIKDSSTTVTGTVYDNTDTSNLLFTKFESSKSQLQTTLQQSGSNVYGLHFMDAQISKNHTVLPSSVFINGTSYDSGNYSMPEDCIDFHLKSKGVINFFSGYYYSARTDASNPGLRNDAFFSLHEIIRNSNNQISQIRHILKVYRHKTNKTLVYYYEDIDKTSVTGYYTLNPNYDSEDPSSQKYNTVSNVSTETYDIVFDKDWIENPEGNWTNNPIVWSTHRNCVFYFEIPVNKGEYALGSVKNKNGTYLIYLDIGANASIVDRTQITQRITQTISNQVYVNGIQILSSASGEINASSSYVAMVPASTQANIIVGSTAIIGKNSENETLNSFNLNMSYNGTGGSITNGTLVPTKIREHQLTTNSTYTVINNTTDVLKFLDYNNGTNSLYNVTVVKKNSTVTYDVYCLINQGTAENRLLTVTTGTNAEYGLLVKGTGTDANYGVEPASASNVINSETITFRDNYATDVILEYTYQVPEDYSKISETHAMTHAEITPTSPNTYKINGNTIDGSSNRLQDGDYYLQHVYRMTGNTITVSIMAPNGATTTDYDTTIQISTYAPNNKENSNDNPPGYVFVINRTTISSTDTTVDVTAVAYSAS